MKRVEKCKSCKHYLEHYVLIGTSFKPIGGGHCINKELYNPRSRHNYELIENCEHWEINTEAKEKQKENIQNTLCYMKEKLDTIEQMLLIDKNENAPD